MMTSTSTQSRLATIATRQSKSRVRDVVFALSVARATVVSAGAMSTAAHAATVQK